MVRRAGVIAAVAAVAGDAIAFAVIGSGESVTSGLRLAVIPVGLVPAALVGRRLLRGSRPVIAIGATFLVALATPFVAFVLAILVAAAAGGLGG